MSIDEDLVTLNSAMTQLMRRIRRVDDEQGIGRARLSALAVLHFGGACTLTELAQAEMVSRATMHHVINGLEQEGHITRTLDEHDARRQVIRLTASGRKAIKAAHGARIRYLRRLVSDMDPADVERAADIMDRLRLTARRN